MSHLKTFGRVLPALSLAVGLAVTLLTALIPARVAGQEAGRSPGGAKQAVLLRGISLPTALPHPRIEVPLSPGGEKSLPSGWAMKEFKGKASVGVEKVGGLFAVRLSSDRSSFALHKELSVDIDEYPHFSWAWRVDRLPLRGDARKSELDDQAAQLYVVFPGFPVPYQIVGYIWDSTAPAGTVLRSAKNPLVRLIVLRSGPDRLGEWVWESRNVFEDFRQLYKEEPTEVMAIALLINSQNTQSSAESRFASMLFTRNPMEGPLRAAATASSSRPSR